METSVQINGVEYIRADSVPAAKPNGNRAVVVVDRGWIFAGHVNGYGSGYGYGYGYGDVYGDGYGNGDGTCSPHRGRRLQELEKGND